MPLRADPLAKAERTIETALGGLGGDPVQARAGDRQWLVAKGTAVVLVRLVPQEGKHPYLQLVSPVMKAPKDPRFRDRLLDLNFEMGGLATFALTPGGEAHLLFARTTENLTATELAQLVANLAHFGDLYDDPLLEEFGRDLALRPEQRRAAAQAAPEPVPLQVVPKGGKAATGKAGAAKPGS